MARRTKQQRIRTPLIVIKYEGEKKTTEECYFRNFRNRNFNNRRFRHDRIRNNRFKNNNFGRRFKSKLTAEKLDKDLDNYFKNNNKGENYKEYLDNDLEIYKKNGEKTVEKNENVNKNHKD